MVPRPGRWYNMGLPLALEILERHGFNVINSDIGALKRDPINHFQRK
jgi:hypothetical protein